MTQGRLSADIKCDPASKTNHRNTQKASAGPVYSYEKRPRRKTKADRYEPYKEPTASEQGSSRLKHSQKRTIVMKRNNFRVAEKFHAKNVTAGRLTLISNEKLGIFKKGKTSSPISCVKVSYPNFSELQFLAKDPQAATPKEEGNASLDVVKRTRLPSSEGSTTLIEEELFQALADCRQLAIPYEEFVPRFPNRRPVSLDNLKGLCKETDMMWSERKENHAMGTDSSTSCHTRTGDACLSISGHNNATSDLGQGEEMFDMVLESVQSVDEDLALEV